MGYTAGLLSDIARVALLISLPDGYAIFMDQVLTRDIGKLEAERDLCASDHCKLGHYQPGIPGGFCVMSWRIMTRVPRRPAPNPWFRPLVAPRPSAAYTPWDRTAIGIPTGSEPCSLAGNQGVRRPLRRYPRGHLEAQSDRLQPAGTAGAGPEVTSRLTAQNNPCAPVP
jgi:hypothetical protein